jgi:ATP-binding cassette subfamily B multidrug efflux pump
MNDILKLLHFVKPYWRRAAIALILLSSLVLADLSIPYLVERIIDQGIKDQNQHVVITTAVIMLGISLLSFIIAIGNNITSVQVSENVGRDLRDAIFTKIQSFSYGDLDR